MTGSNPKVADEIERDLWTGDTDVNHIAWSGGFMERVHQAHDDLRRALLRRVHQLASDRRHQPVPDGDAVALTRGKVEPMVRDSSPAPSRTWSLPSSRGLWSS